MKEAYSILDWKMSHPTLCAGDLLMKYLNFNNQNYKERDKQDFGFAIMERLIEIKNGCTNKENVNFTNLFIFVFSHSIQATSICNLWSI